MPKTTPTPTIDIEDGNLGVILLRRIGGEETAMLTPEFYEEFHESYPEDEWELVEEE